MTADGTPLVLERELHIEARPEIVFRFFTERDFILRWQGIDASIDPHEGGQYRIDINSDDSVSGRFVEVTPHSRLVYTWGWERGGVPGFGPGSSQVDITLEAEGAGTRLRLVHTGLPPDRDVADSHGDGWSYYLMRLADVIAGKPLQGDGHSVGMDVIKGATAQFDSRYGPSRTTR